MAALTADDRLAIQEILSRYCWIIDHGRWDEMPGLFSPDCVLDFGTLMGRHEGHDGVRTLAGMIGGTGLMMRHYVTNVVIEGDGDRAHADTYVLALTGPGPGSFMQTTGRYADDFVKRDGRWYLRQRVAVIEMPGAR